MQCFEVGQMAWCSSLINVLLGDRPAFVQDIDELIEKFKTADDQNYTLFTYVNELNQEITKLEEQVKGIDSEIEAAQRQAVARASARLKVQQEVCPLCLILVHLLL
jgi:uncharacterized protein YdcH (DUF465 family)